MATLLASIAIVQHRNRIASREKDEQLQLAAECADMGTWEWNLSNDEFTWSERCRQMFGVTGNQNDVSAISGNNPLR